MGNDGGSIPRRIELIKEAARKPNTSELKATLLEAQTHAWTTCPLSNRPLADPIVSDCAGILYNKDALLEQLLPSVEGALDDEVLQGRVKGLRDVVEIKFTLLKEGKEEKHICSITSKELGPATKSVYLVPCGHAFSEVAIQELKGDRCIECNEAYTPENVITILPSTPNEVEKLSSRISKLKEMGLTHSLKKKPGGKKRKKETPLSATSDKIPSASSHIIKNAATASLTSKVLEEQEERNKRRKQDMNENLKSLFSSKGYNAHTQKNGDFMTRGFSLPSNKQ
ncbi:hypothetical protein K3495_g4107 [Podosphaera aphanis]|nr:hypothetical protein K3495_g4107 [Podosphaera aphanis]